VLNEARASKQAKQRQKWNHIIIIVLLLNGQTDDRLGNVAVAACLFHIIPFPPTATTIANDGMKSFEL